MKSIIVCQARDGASERPVPCMEKTIMKLSLIFSVFFLTVCAEIIASAVLAAGPLPFFVKMAVMPAVMLVVCVGITENFLKKTGISYLDAGIALPDRARLPGLVLYALFTAGVWLLLIPPYTSVVEVAIPSVKKWVFNDVFWKNILADKDIRPVFRHALLVYSLLMFAIAEELIFRGFLLKYLRKNSSAAIAVLVSALLFSLVHLSPLAIVLTLPLGLLLGALMLRTGNIVAPIAAHFLFNLALIYIYGGA